MVSCGGNKQQQPGAQGPAPAIPVTVAKVTTTDAVYFDEYPGYPYCPQPGSNTY